MGWKSADHIHFPQQGQRMGPNGVTTVGGARSLQRVRPFDVVFVRSKPADANTPSSPVPGGDSLRVAVLDPVSGAWSLVDMSQGNAAAQTIPLSDGQFNNAEVRPLSVLVEAVRPSANLTDAGVWFVPRIQDRITYRVDQVLQANDRLHDLIVGSGRAKPARVSIRASLRIIKRMRKKRTSPGDLLYLTIHADP